MTSTPVGLLSLRCYVTCEDLVQVEKLRIYRFNTLLFVNAATTKLDVKHGEKKRKKLFYQPPSRDPIRLDTNDIILPPVDISYEFGP